MKHTPCPCSEVTGLNQLALPLTSQGLPFPLSLISFPCSSTIMHIPLHVHPPSKGSNAWPQLTIMTPKSYYHVALTAK